MPSGYEMIDFYVLEYPDWINVIAITDEGKFLLERQYRHGINSVHYELCAGGVEKGETPLEAAKRELLEETGYSSDEWESFGIYAPNPNSMTNKCYTFIARNIEKISDPHREQSEDIELHFVSEEEIKILLKDGEIMEGVMQAPLWRYLTEIHK